MWKCKACRIAKTTWKKSKVGGLTQSGFKTYYKADRNQDRMVFK